MNKIQKLKIQLENTKTELKSAINFEDTMNIQNKIMALYEEINNEQINQVKKDEKVINKDAKVIKKSLINQIKQ
jgi:hypothetical protein